MQINDWDIEGTFSLMVYKPFEFFSVELLGQVVSMFSKDIMSPCVNIWPDSMRIPSSS